MKIEIDGVVIEERPTGRCFYGEYIWPASLVLCDFLKRNSELVRGKRVLELGSGTGIAGLYAAKLGAEHVTLTDFIDWKPRWFRWGTNLCEKWDVIIGSDIIYPAIDLLALVKAIQSHLKHGGRCILAHHERGNFSFPFKFKELESHERNSKTFSKFVRDSCPANNIKIIEITIEHKASTL